MRLDQFIRKRTGLAGRARRDALSSGDAVVNGETITKPGHPLRRFDRVEFRGEVLQERTPRYLMLHKPAGHLSATRDSEHPTVIDLLDQPWKDELHLAGRLDRSTTGLVVLTNDSTFSEALTAPHRKVPKGYLVGCEQVITQSAIDAIRAGVRFEKEDITTQPAQLEPTGDRACDLTIYEGKHHQIKRMFARFDIKVTKLHRYRIGDILLDPALAPGAHRELDEAERKIP